MGIINIGDGNYVNPGENLIVKPSRQSNPGLVMFNAIQTRHGVTLEMAKLHMRVDGNLEDSLIQKFINAAAQKADTFCQNLFLGKDGRTKLDIPEDIDVWILMTATKLYNKRMLGEQRTKIQDLGEVQYVHGDAVDIDYTDLKPYRIEPGFGGFFFA